MLTPESYLARLAPFFLLPKIKKLTISVEIQHFHQMPQIQYLDEKTVMDNQELVIDNRGKALGSLLYQTDFPAYYIWTVQILRLFAP